MHDIGNGLSATELYTYKWFVLYDVYLNNKRRERTQGANKKKDQHSGHCMVGKTEETGNPLSYPGEIQAGGVRMSDVCPEVAVGVGPLCVCQPGVWRVCRPQHYQEIEKSLLNYFSKLDSR